MEDILSESLIELKSIHQKIFQGECYNLLIVYNHVKEYTYFDELLLNNQMLLISIVYSGLKEYNGDLTKIFLDGVLKQYRIKECIKDGSRNKNSIVYNRMLVRYARQLLENFHSLSPVTITYLDELFKWKKELTVEEKEEIKNTIECGHCKKKIKIIEIDEKKYYECKYCNYCSIIKTDVICNKLQDRHD